MKLNRKSSFMVFVTLVVLLCQVDFNMARPNSSRGNRRNSNKTKDNKAKRNWSDSPALPSVAEESVSPKIEILSGSDDSLQELSDVNTETVAKEKPTPLAPQKWLELERVLPANVEAKLNSDLTLECIAVGSPPPSVYWLKDGKPIENAMPFDSEQLANHVFGWSLLRNQPAKDFSMSNVRSKIPLRCLRPEDQGEYTCVAENDGKKMASSTLVTVNVEEETSELRPECELKSALVSYSKKGRKNQPAFIMSYEYLHMEPIGNDIMLTCRGVGRPRPQTSWVDFEGRKIINGKKFQVTHTGNLVIRNLSWREMGEYTCQVENQLGSDSASTFLYPLLVE